MILVSLGTVVVVGLTVHGLIYMLDTGATGRSPPHGTESKSRLPLTDGNSAESLAESPDKSPTIPQNEPDAHTPVEVLQLAGVPKLWKGPRAEPSIEGQMIAKINPKLAGQSKAWISIRASMGPVEVEFTPIPPFLDMPASPSVARSSAIDRVGFIETHYRARRARGHVYELNRGNNQKEFAKVIPCMMRGDPGNVMILGNSIEAVESAHERLRKYKPGE